MGDTASSLRSLSLGSRFRLQLGRRSRRLMKTVNLEGVRWGTGTRDRAEGNSQETHDD